MNDVIAMMDREKDPKKAQTVYYQWNIEVKKMDEFYKAENFDHDDPESVMMQIARDNNENRLMSECSIRKEKGLENDHVHYQGFLKLAKKSTLNGLLKSDNWLIRCLRQKGHIMYSHAKNDGYLDKISTGISPKVRMKDVKEPPKLKMNFQARFVQHLIDTDKLHSWQEDVLSEIGDLLHTPRDWRHWMENELFTRKVSIICDPVGGTGKSMLQQYLKCTEHLYYQLPPLQSGQEINQFMTSSLKDRADKHLPKVVAINWSRAFSGNLNKKAIMGFFMGVESVKDGECYDTRYSGTKLEFEFAPAVYVFCNEIPKFVEKALSANRWNIRYIVKGDDWSDGNADWELSRKPPVPAGTNDVNNDDLAGGDAPPQFEPARVPGMHHVLVEESEDEEGDAAEGDRPAEAGVIPESPQHGCPFVDDEATVKRPAKRARTVVNDDELSVQHIVHESLGL